MPAAAITRTGLKFEQITVSTVAVALNPPKASAQQAGANYVFVSVENANVRYRDDGTDPTATSGHPLNAGQTLSYDGSPEKLRFIRSGAADAVVNATHMR